MNTTFPIQNGKKFQADHPIWPGLLYVNQICPPVSPDKEKGFDSIHEQSYVKHGYIR